MAKAQVTIPLEIPEVRVLKSEINSGGELIITIESTKETAVCQRCEEGTPQGGLCKALHNVLRIDVARQSAKRLCRRVDSRHIIQS